MQLNNSFVPVYLLVCVYKSDTVLLVAGTPERVHYRGIAPCPLKGGDNGGISALT